MTTLHRAGSILLAVSAWLVLAASPALADPPGPTDYQTEVIGIEPATPGFRVEIIGGDSFVLIEVDTGIALDVIGYRGEPYLRFLADGTVEQNDNSPTTYLNTDRYGTADIPAGATADAEPAWRVVATDGSFAWHDHRTHWMNPPSAALALGGMALGLAIVVAAAIGRVRVPVLAGILISLTAAASVLGVIAVFSVPSETSPPWSLWVPPLTALVMGVAALGGRSIAVLHRWRASLALLGTLILTAWGFLHQEWMWKAVLPTGSPFWAERFVTGTVLAAGIGLVLLIGRAQVLGTDPD